MGLEAGVDRLLTGPVDIQGEFDGRFPVEDDVGPVRGFDQLGGRVTPSTSKDLDDNGPPGEPAGLPCPWPLRSSAAVIVADQNEPVLVLAATPSASVLNNPSSSPASSVKLTRTLMVISSSSSRKAQVPPAAPGMPGSSVPSVRTHR